MKNKIVIDGKEFALPDSLVNEIKEKLSPKEPTTFEECVGVHKEAWVTNCPSPTWVDSWHIRGSLLHGEAVPSEKRANQLAAIAKMMTVADALNNSCDFSNSCWGSVSIFTVHGKLEIYPCASARGVVRFKDRKTAEKAIQILGEDTIKTAFGL